MNRKLPDIQEFQTLIFKKKDILRFLLSFSRRLLKARQAGLMFGTDYSGEKFLPPYKWDRGVVHKLDGRGAAGLLFQWFGPGIVKIKRLSPVYFSRTDPFGDVRENEGVVAYILRKHKDYYAKGIKVLIINGIGLAPRTSGEPGRAGKIPNDLPVISYDGKGFDMQADIRVDPNIIGYFRPDNFVSAYVPDYGAIIFNTVDRQLLKMDDKGFVHGDRLKKRMDTLVSAIETASLAYLGKARGRSATKLIWRKEKRLRKTWTRLKEKEAELDEQKKQLMAVGAVKASQLKMTPVMITDGVYAFLDMVGSVRVRNCLSPREYFLILNLCHEIAAETAAVFSCRVDNFIGDSVFLQNVSIFDDPGLDRRPGPAERVMLLVCALASIFNEIHRIRLGSHPMDREKRIRTLMRTHSMDIGFRAGLEFGPALVGPLGSSRRRIVTAIGTAVNTASRLESTGVSHKIHTSEEVLNLLEENLVSKDTAMIWKIGIARGIFDRRDTEKSLSFFKFYREYFHLDQQVVEENTNACYKEFSRELTYFIQCIPGSESTRVCAGI
ncbi:adenylate/guanylate cyclase domain-containing protein [Desulfospira joergensenii]|uniref:adenylate/guanylate cyclase domain-containing protein n=1 Tax=Desulfospira joergensenii TaxID=53329 RepID=UPI0003F7546A|nr:adenylate/guanylate cyclase domain-containing protein [Desulfospira joergensenii]